MTDQGEVPETSARPQTAGDRLRQAREAAGLSIADIAARTRISQRHVEHIEAGQFSAFPSRTYALGFARTIARSLGLDGEEIARLVRAEIGMTPAEARRTDAYEPGDPARLPSRPLVWLSIAAAALLLAGLFMAYRTYFSPAAELPSLVEEQEAQERAAAAARQQAAATPATPAASGPVVFTATGDGVWVRFYDAAGLRLLEKEMARGETFTIPADAAGPMIRTARPDLLAITIGGRPVAPLATQMVTLRDVKVDAASLLARAPQPAASAGTAGVPAAANVGAPVRTKPISEGTRLPRLSPTPRASAPRAAIPAPRTATVQDAAAANAAGAPAAAASAPAISAATSAGNSTPPAADSAPEGE